MQSIDPRLAPAQYYDSETKEEVPQAVLPQLVSVSNSSGNTTPTRTPSELQQRIESYKELALQDPQSKNPAKKGFFKDKAWMILGSAIACQITAGLVSTFSDSDDTLVKVIAAGAILIAVPAEAYFVWHEYQQNKKQEQEKLGLFKEMLDHHFERFTAAYPRGYPEVNSDNPEKMEKDVRLYFIDVKHHHKYYERSRQRLPQVECPPPPTFEKALSDLIASLGENHPLLNRLGISSLFKDQEASASQQSTFPGELSAFRRSSSDEIDKKNVTRIFENLEQKIGVSLQWVEKNGIRCHRDGSLDRVLNV
ncbi:MAG: hypothetical protein WD595_02945 [Waddliaceae bacterium]